MKKQLKQRLTRLVETFGTVPVPPSIVEAAFEEFRRTGELPEDARVAHAVTQRAKTGFPTVYRPDGTMDWGATQEVARQSPRREADPILDELYLEAVFGPELVRWAARQVLRALAAVGEDVSRPQFLDWQPELSEFGTVGLSLLGFPQRLAKAPHADRANKLFARMQEDAERAGRLRAVHGSRLRARLAGVGAGAEARLAGALPHRRG